ncbi:hypothetical protein [Microvirga lotononidis]|uniref:Uncharacterized protein n=1 Tax=Microvirga lotononidis TaxID=864069 RepID=I4YN37_9HYPH|nr:hypothetical protein [Microvirga lotononidis]EIM25379.1 hypothetical protein MicloDRAFT_00061050 [Microvirga lotononidis]WQO27323.1 hypothetical protein U0023_22200 [Microvirga lotononidis]
MTLREALDGALEEALQRQSFAPLEHLFGAEEAAMAACERLAAALAAAEQRCVLLRVALAHERDLAASGPIAWNRLH